MTKAQVNQSRILLRALQRACDKLTDSLNNSLGLDDSIIEQRRFAIDALVQARLRIELSRKNVYDLKLKHLLLHLGQAETFQVKIALETFMQKEPTLVEFGNVPWFKIDEAFAKVQTRCPLALQKFHAEYQEEIRIGSNLNDIFARVAKCHNPR